MGVTRHRVPQDDDDPIVTTIRAALTRDTIGSFKKSICACLIIFTTGLSLTPRRRIWIPVTLVASLAVVARWHTLVGLL